MKNTSNPWLATQDPIAASDSVGADNGSTKNKVERLDNRIYFYSEVLRPQILILNKQIRTLNIRLRNSAAALSHPPANIHLHINSFGGSLFSGLCAVDNIKKSDAPIHSIIDGCAASAATLMSVVAAERYINEHSFMLIHQLSSGFWGKFEELKDGVENSTLLMQTIKKIYDEHTRIPKKKLNEILKRDLWFDAKTCLDYGLVDEII
jgi:ATP-dependent Clp endopeptidase proteolytic subunit ClpP